MVAQRNKRGLLMMQSGAACWNALVYGSGLALCRLAAAQCCCHATGLINKLPCDAMQFAHGHIASVHGLNITMRCVSELYIRAACYSVCWSPLALWEEWCEAS